MRAIRAICVLRFCFLHAVWKGGGLFKAEQPCYKHQAENGDASFGVSRKLGRNTDYHGADKSRALAENIEKAKVFARFFLGIIFAK